RLPPGSSPLRLLEQSPGVHLTSADPWASYEWSTRLSLRGFAQTQLGFTLDGIPLGDMSYANHSGLHLSRALIAENLAFLELAQGSAALDTPAAHALGGTVAAFTRGPTEAFGIHAAQSVGSDGLRRSFARIDSGTLGPWQFALSGADHTTDKWKGWGEQNLRQFNGFLRGSFGALELSGYVATARRRDTDYMDFSLDSQRRLGWDWDYYAPDWARAIAAAEGQFSGGVETLDDAYYLGRGLRDDDLGYLSLDWDGGEAWSLHLTGYAHRNEGQGHWTTPYTPSPDVPISLRTTEYDIDRSGLLPQGQFALGTHELSVGGWLEHNTHDLRRNFYHLLRSEPPNAARFYRDPDQAVFAQRFHVSTREIYLSDRWTLDDRWALEWGAKASDVRIRAKSLLGNRAAGVLRTRDHFQPQISLRRRIGADQEAFVAANQRTAALRPGIDGPFSTTQEAFDAFAGSLRAEQSRLIEAGWRRRGPQGELALAAYRIDFDDRLLGIARCSGIVGCPFGFANVGSVVSQGVEGVWRRQIGAALSLRASLSYNDARYRDDYLDGTTLVPTRGKRVVDAPRWLASTQLEWRRNDWRAGLRARHHGDRAITYSNDAEVAGVTLVDLDLAYDASRWLRRGRLEFRAQLNNVFDRRYFATVGSNGFVAFDPDGQHYTLLRGAPRQFFVSVDLAF
ncbi:MAG: TonB-dependent receptor, partial [Xanthomonadales bacterium]|nr:TonB-dependent receptor [Xanthomonadales bacterium]